ncbi:alpha/beta hydrolase [Paeniglutamicibacter terrestris]|uniref:Alpha/beta hydrolase n=1 Tax=Paeniglutamicibacter terrestris TaxID=2723403 RepID=A0ABX1G8N2_9MICC|nr:alpha/beta hydrolase [Paeniglutamicibacter terrestris]ASN40532.1 alpha/beta hydrolase [Arthrobacter sp. 7749]NKG22615.1 alpha/beta hydrolase [Paeniglutamicibacter terrestris]
MRAPRRHLSVMSLLASMALLLSGCSVTTTPVSESTATAPGTAAKAPKGLEKFYTQNLEWNSCDGSLKCAELSVPMDYANPAGETLSLKLNKRPGSGTVQGSLLVNPGGPGASGLDLVRDSVPQMFGRSLQDGFDIVGFDPRGVASSSPVKCEDAAEQDAGRQVQFDTSTDAGLASMRASSADYAALCAERTGAALGFVDTVSAARDMDVMRAVLGDEKLNFLGFSYGTSLGAHYAEMFPKNVGRLVLDGALDPALSNEEITLGQAVGFENEIRAYLQDCLASGDCPFTGSLDDALTQLRALLDSVEANPMVASDGRSVPIIDFVNGFIIPLYDNASWPTLTQALSSVMDGDVDTIEYFADLSAGRTSEGTYSGNGAASFTAINCLDYPMNADVATMRADAATLTKAAPTIGKYLAFGAVGCQDWEFKATGKPGELTAKGAAPIVVIGTTGDPATPYAWSQSLAKSLDSGSLVTYQGHGHTAYGRSNGCVSDAVESYLLEGKVPTDGLTC